MCASAELKPATYQLIKNISKMPIEIPKSTNNTIVEKVSNLFFDLSKKEIISPNIIKKTVSLR